MRLWVVAGVLCLAACAPDNTDTVTVFAASSLKTAFTDIERIYEQQNPGSNLSFSFGGSADLVAQLDQGAPADALATADEQTMQRSGLPDAQPFATNTMTIVVQPGNPRSIRSLVDLRDPNLSVSICAPQVPCGAATERILSTAGIDLQPDSEESAVADVLGKVSSGQADAGVVYVSDARGAGVEAVTIPADLNTVNRYLIASVEPAGEGFIDFVLGEQGQDVLRANGFGPP